jgi:ribonucleoside-diphosphate reductase alpha chain
VYRQIPKRRKRAKFGVNPCGEVILRSGQMCNLSIAVARADDTPATLTEKVELATILGTFQSTLTNFGPFLREQWKQNCDEERLLGVDINGQMDCPLLRPGAAGREALLRELKEVVLRTNAEWAGRLGIPVSAATTVVKPSGNSALFFGCSSGMHARWSRHQVRRVRVGRYNPIARLLQGEGVPHAIDPMNDTLLVFDFLPDPAPEGTPTRNDLSAIEQFQNWLTWKTCWTEHNPSATIYVGDDEWLELGAEVYKHFDQVGGVTFLPRMGGTYRLAPNEELTAEDYTERRKAFPTINWAKLAQYEREDSTNPLGEVACAGGACELS